MEGSIFDLKGTNIFSFRGKISKYQTCPWYLAWCQTTIEEADSCKNIGILFYFVYFIFWLNLFYILYFEVYSIFWFDERYCIITFISSSGFPAEAIWCTTSLGVWYCQSLLALFEEIHFRVRIYCKLYASFFVVVYLFMINYFHIT